MKPHHYGIEAVTFIIEHVKQPNVDTCACACVAMLTGQSIHKTIQAFHDDYYTGRKSLGEIMDCLELNYQAWAGLDTGTIANYLPGAYLCSVPSLTARGRLHYIVIERSDDQYKVLDPMRGTGRPFYSVPEDDLQGCVPLTSWTVAAFIPLDGLKARRLH